MRKGRLEDLLDSRLSLRQIMHLGIVAGIAVGIPYLAIGLLWLATHHDHLDNLHGADQFFSVVGEVIAWPPLLVSNIALS